MGRQSKVIEPRRTVAVTYCGPAGRQLQCHCSVIEILSMAVPERGQLVESCIIPGSEIPYHSRSCMVAHQALIQNRPSVHQPAKYRWKNHSFAFAKQVISKTSLRLLPDCIESLTVRVYDSFDCLLALTSMQSAMQRLQVVFIRLEKVAVQCTAKTWHLEIVRRDSTLMSTGRP